MLVRGKWLAYAVCIDHYAMLIRIDIVTLEIKRKNISDHLHKICHML